MTPSPLFLRLGLTVGHALWELAALGLLTWIGLACLRRSTPQARYAWACLGLAAMVVVPLATFLLLPAEPETGLFLGQIQVEVTDAAAADFLSWLRDLDLPGLLHRSSPWLAGAWLAGAGLMALRFGLTVLWLHYSFERHCRAASAELEARFQRLRNHFGLPESIQLRLSPGADTPMVLGWWRPVVLLPVAALLHLTPESLEAVLAHELAHLRRRDPLVNLFQCIAEALLFFHPLAWWLSREIRDLREQCCDDEAVALMRDPLPLAEGLAALAQLSHRPSTLPDPALAAAKGPLMSRITRLFRPDITALPSPRALGWGLAALLACGTLAVAQEKKAAPKPKAPKSDTPKDSDSTGPVAMEFHQMKIKSRPKSLDYPKEAREAMIQGTVQVELVVAPDGSITAAKAINGPAELRGAAEGYAREWRFKPPMKNGKPIAARFLLTINFKLM